MWLRRLGAFCFVCALLCLSAAAQTEAPYPPFRAGSSPVFVQRTPASAPQVVPPSGAFWTKARNAPAVSVGAMLLLTDGRVLVHSEPNCTGCTGNYNNWYTLTPDNHGNYINGTWRQVASFPSGYEPLFFGSAVLADGKVVAQGGEYNCPGGSCSADHQSLGAIYDPAANTWTATHAPSHSNIGDAESVVLPTEPGCWQSVAPSFSETAPSRCITPSTRPR